MTKKLKIFQYPNKNLSIPCVEVDIKNKEKMEEIRKLVLLLDETMKFYDGIGIAAPQVGVHYAVMLVSDGVMEPIAMINPTIVYRSPNESNEIEGCLSFPGITAHITRSTSVFVEYADIYGTIRGMDAQGLLSRCIQHELEHLSGKTFINKMSSIRRAMVEKKMRRKTIPSSLLEM